MFEKGTYMKDITTSEFVTSSTGSSFPKEELPEAAFLGRSNCGKSSLINMIVNRKNLVKTGQTPGMTKLINYFLINNKMHLVDLPGYGFAKIPVKEKKKLEALIYKYIDTRAAHIKLFFLLMDIRRTPTEDEKKLMKLLAKKKIPAAFTLTKADKVNRKERHTQLNKIQKELGISTEHLFITSSHSKEGRESLLDVINPYL
jgi:GTP-binding protein